MKIDLTDKERLNIKFLLNKQKIQQENLLQNYNIGSASYHLIAKSIKEIDDTIKKFVNEEL